MKRVNINEILSQYHPVVPEIQRDYVWGQHPEVLAQFIGDLNSKLREGNTDKANVGFLYSYPRGNENYVIDGQQRLTTILLLLHVLSLQSAELHAHFKSLILPDDINPAFAYRVRPTSLSFMKMLFKSDVVDSGLIRNLKDYKLCYDNDLTVKSCLMALDWFSANLSKYSDLNYYKVLGNVEFWYFGVDQTSQGEELYITMNSRGEWLTESEHIKPKLFDKLDKEIEKLHYGKAWDEWEEFFYRNRNGRSINSVDIAMDNIIRIVVELKTGNILDKGLSARYAEDITLDDISSYMSALIQIHEMTPGKEVSESCGLFISREISRLYGDDNDKPGFADGDFNVLKTLLTEYLRLTTTSFHNLEQVYHLMRNLIVRGILRSSKNLLELLSDLKKSDISFYDYMLWCSENDEWHSVITGRQEPLKIRIFKSKGEAAERQIWDAQETLLWKGDVRPLLDWATDKGSIEDADSYSVAAFDRMHGLFKEFFNENKKEGLASDETRRALLTFNMVAYPWWQYDRQAYFGHNADEWRQIILKNPGEFRNFLHEYSESGKTAHEFCQSRIEECPAEKTGQSL